MSGIDESFDIHGFKVMEYKEVLICKTSKGIVKAVMSKIREMINKNDKKGQKNRNGIFNAKKP